MKKAVAYLRVSTESELICIEEDAGISGKDIRHREGLQRAIEVSCDEQAILIVYSLSRLSRSTRDTLALVEKLDKAGADLVSLSEKIDTTSAAGKMVFRMLAVLNEFERDQISERTSAVLQHKKSKLEAYSPTPYGFKRRGKSLIEDEVEQKVVLQIQELQEKGCSLREIARRLNEAEIPSKKGGQWYASSVRYILSNTLYEEDDNPQK